MADRENHARLPTAVIATKLKHDVINQSLAIARPHGLNAQRGMTRTRSMSRAAASTTSAATPQSPCNRVRGPGQATAAIACHAWANQKNCVRGVSARMTMRKRRNGLGPRIQKLRSIESRSRQPVHRAYATQKL